jgi:hypothetical protein
MNGAHAEARAVVAAGHMVDAPDRPTPRFPPDQVARVRAEVRVALERWGVGPQTTVVTSGARGADMIAAEECLELGSRVELRLAFEPGEFERRSVALPDSDWSERFRAVLDRDRVNVQVLDAARQGDDVFARTNEWIVETARRLDDAPRALVVWDGAEGDGPGGTRHLVRLLGYTGPDPGVAVIDPTRRAYAAREQPDQPKRLLALDGGGLRGALSLEILRTLETSLRERYGAETVLSDYFDYIAGTSTGAIIAAALALGKPVAELQEMYRELGKRIFSKRFLPLRLRSLYRDGPLTKELENFFGAGRTLGDPELRTLLLLVLHNTVTDSPWPLSNCTRAKYNRADRNLKTPSDRNLDLPLSTLVRGSTAAPVYFPPQQLQIGSNRFVFQDGGITPFNNPALILFLLATLPEYGLVWPAGEDRLLIVSVGTGSSAAVHPNVLAREVDILFNAKNLPSVFMNGASVSQDLLCRALGRCRAGPQLDREVGNRIGAPGAAGTSLFTYVRYNADLSDVSLVAEGYSDERERKQLRKMDAVGSIPELEALGRAVGERIDFDANFAGFLD